MDIVGVWRVKYLKMLLGEAKMIDLDEIMANPSEEDIDKYGEFAKMKFMFTEDGKMLGLNEIPEGTPQEEIDKAIAQGLTVIDNKYFAPKADTTYEAVGDVFKTSGGEGTHGLSEEDAEALRTINVVDGMLEMNGLFAYYYLVRE